MSFHIALPFLFVAGFLAGVMNALAGGGSFISVPAMIATGMPSVLSNTSSTLALWPGTVVSAMIYPNAFRSVCGIGRWPLMIVTLIGGLIGSLLLLFTPSSSFDVMLPWLLLLATLALIFGQRIAVALEGRFHGSRWVLVAQFILGTYGGYFGGAASIMMLAIWCLFGETDIKSLHGPRTLLITAANTVAIIVFLFARAILWPQTLAMLAGSIIGGFGGARLGRVTPAHIARVVTLCITVTITCAFFAKTYWPP
ncbi:MAG: sulfite exporter TauE/SafE family protein [Methylovirgula sp.]